MYAMILWLSATTNGLIFNHNIIPMFACIHERCNSQYANWISIQNMTVNDDATTAICNERNLTDSKYYHILEIWNAFSACFLKFPSHQYLESFLLDIPRHDMRYTVNANGKFLYAT